MSYAVVIDEVADFDPAKFMELYQELFPYAEYAVTYDDPWRYGECPHEAVVLTPAGYGELLRCVARTAFAPSPF